MKTITIFKPVDNKQSLTKTDRAVIFEQLEHESKIDKYHFEAFAVGEDALVKSTSSINVPGVILRNNAQYFTYITKKPSSTQFSVATQLPYPVYAVDEELQNRRVIPTGVDVSVTGVIFDTDHKIITTRDPFQIDKASFHDRLITGNYDYRFNILKLIQRQDVVHFTQSDVLSKLRKIQDYIDFRTEYHNSSTALMYNTMLSLPYRNHTVATNIIVPPYQVPDILNNNMNYPNRLLNDKIILLYDVLSSGLWQTYHNNSILGPNDPKTMASANNTKKRQSENKSMAIEEIDSLQRMGIHQKRSDIAWRLFHKNLSQLTVKELGAVDITLQKDTAYKLHVSANKCIHLDLISRIGSDKTAWSELKNIVTKGVGILDCNLCKLPAVCSHTYERLDSKFSELHDIYMTKYVDKTPVDNSYFCKYCGEVLIVFYDESFAYSEEKASVVHDELAGKIWKECRVVLQTFVKFTVQTDVKALTSSMTDSIRYALDAEYSKIQQNDDLQYMYISIYIYACLVRLMLHNKDIQFVQNNKKVGGGNELPILIKTALRILISSKETLIQRLVNISIDSIKAIFTNAFKQMANLQVTMHAIDTMDASFIVTDPTYKYMHYVMSKTENIPITAVDKVLNATLKDLEIMDNIVDKNYNPPIWPLKMPPFGVFYSKEEAEKYHAYAYASFIHYINYLHQGIYKLTLNGSFKREAYGRNYKLLHKMEKKYRYEYPIARYNQYGFFVLHNLKPYEIYCDTGLRHNFNVYIYESGLVEIMISASNVKQWMTSEKENKELHNMVLKGIACSKCKVMAGTIGDDPSISKAVDQITELESFYNFYKFKCPIDGTHKPMDLCAKCSLTRLMVLNKDKKYYRTHSKKFQTEMKIIKARGFDLPEPPPNPTTEKKWEASQLLELSVLSKRTKIPNNIMRNLGLVETHSYADILSGSVNPSDTELKHSPARVYTLNTYVQLIIIEFEKLRNGTSPTVEEWRDKTEYSKLELLSDYNEEFRSRQHLSYELLSNFILFSMASELNKFANTHVDNMFVQYIMDKIIALEKSASDPGIIRGQVTETEEVDATEYNEVELVDDPFSMENSGLDMENVGDNLEGK